MTIVQFSGFRGTELRRVRVRGTPADPLSARQRLERALTAVDWMPPQLPPRALLFVRRLVFAAPSRRGFGEDVTKALRRRADAARRPWVHADAVSADTVIFADEAELVACLIRDWLRGALADRWWWRDVLRSASAEDWLRRHALPRGELLVPAMSLLEPRREAVASIARLSDADSRIAIRAIARAFALPALEPADASGNIETSSATDLDDAPGARRPERDVLTATADARRRLIALAPEILDSRLGREQRHLVAVVLATLRAPSWTRVPEFALAVAASDRIETPRELPPDASRVVPRVVTRRAHTVGSGTTGRGSDPDDAPKPSTHPTDRARASDPAPGAQRKEVRRAHAQKPFTIEPPGPRGPRRRRRPARILRGSLASPSSDVRTVDAPPALERTGDHIELDGPLPRPAPRTDAVSLPAVAGAWSETDYGGIFYLLNAWIAMGLYGDFTAPRAANLALSPWNLLALVGRAWFGEGFTADPVWIVLAELAVRDPDDEPDRDRVLSEGWLERHLDALAARLQLALGSERVADVPAILCRHRARIETSASALHVRLSLSDLPLEIRIAGLDRDPGWIPAAGRAVAFHFD